MIVNSVRRVVSRTLESCVIAAILMNSVRSIFSVSVNSDSFVARTGYNCDDICGDYLSGNLRKDKQT